MNKLEVSISIENCFKNVYLADYSDNNNWDKAIECVSDYVIGQVKKAKVEVANEIKKDIIQAYEHCSHISQPNLTTYFGALEYCEKCCDLIIEANSKD